MKTHSTEFAAVLLTAAVAVTGWTYLIAELAHKLAYPSIL